jgi:hypothetical protein
MEAILDAASFKAENGGHDRNSARQQKPVAGLSS